LLPLRGWATNNSLHLLQLHFANASALPLAISLDVVSDWRQPPGAQQYFKASRHYVPFTDLFHLIFTEFAARLGSLKISVGADSDDLVWTKQIGFYMSSKQDNGQAVTYPKLTCLNFGNRIGISPQNVPAHFFSTGVKLSQLRHLALHCDISTIPQVPLENLTILQLSGSKPIDCFDILAQYPKLVEFHAKHMRPSHPARFVDEGREPPPPPPPPPPGYSKGNIITLTNLQKLV
jgi:hypothetical protein